MGITLRDFSLFHLGIREYLLSTIIMTVCRLDTKRGGHDNNNNNKDNNNNGKEYFYLPT